MTLALLVLHSTSYQVLRNQTQPRYIASFHVSQLYLRFNLLQPTTRCCQILSSADDYRAALWREFPRHGECEIESQKSRREPQRPRSEPQRPHLDLRSSDHAPGGDGCLSQRQSPHDLFWREVQPEWHEPLRISTDSCKEVSKARKRRLFFVEKGNGPEDESGASAHPGLEQCLSTGPDFD